MNRIVVAVACLLGLTGLPTPAATLAPTATLSLKKGYDKGSGLGTGTAQFYDYAPDNRCSGRKRLYKFSLITGAQANKPVPAGKKLVISAYTNRYNSRTGTSIGVPGVSVESATCENRLEFVPLPGETYDVVQKVEVGKSCKLEIISQKTGKVPDDLQELNPVECISKK